MYTIYFGFHKVGTYSHIGGQKSRNIIVSIRTQYIKGNNQVIELEFPQCTRWWHDGESLSKGRLIQHYLLMFLYYTSFKSLFVLLH